MRKFIQRAIKNFALMLQAQQRSTTQNSRCMVSSAAGHASDRISRTLNYPPLGRLGLATHRLDAFWRLLFQCGTATRRLSRWCIVLSLCGWFVMSFISSAWSQTYRSYTTRNVSWGWRTQEGLLPQYLEFASRQNAAWILLSRDDDRKRSSKKKKSDRKSGRDDRRSPKDSRGKSKDKYKQWESLSPEERQELRRRMKRWKQLSPEERQLFRRRHEQWQELSPEERRSIQRKLQKWDKLTPKEQDEIRQRFKQ